MYCLLKKNMDICWSKKCRSNYFFPIKKRERFFPTKIYYYSTPLFDDPPLLTTARRQNTHKDSSSLSTTTTTTRARISFDFGPRDDVKKATFSPKVSLGFCR